MKKSEEQLHDFSNEMPANEPLPPIRVEIQNLVSMVSGLGTRLYTIEQAQQNISDKIAMLPTPQNRDYKGQSQRGKYQEDALPNAIVFQDGKKTGMRLQPSFVEWMQGFPIGWTDLNL